MTVGTSGTLTSAFAIGMVVGAPLMAGLARNWPARSTLLGFVLVCAAAHALGATTTNFAVLFATRVVAALANAGFLAVALTGTMLGWRATFWAVAALCLPAAIGILKGIPAGPARGAESPAPALRAEFAQLRSPRLALVMLLGALVNAATFASFTFLAPIVTGTAGLSDLWASVVAVLFGPGSFVGITVAGRVSDHRPDLVVMLGGPLLLLGWPALAVTAEQPAALLLLVFLQGALWFALGSTLITRVLYEATGAPTMAGSYATAAFNIGAAVGPLIAATALDTALGELGPLWVSGLLIAIALLVTFPFRSVIAARHKAELLQ